MLSTPENVKYYTPEAGAVKMSISYMTDIPTEYHIRMTVTDRQLMKWPTSEIGVSVGYSKL